jgi:very-short-patch-repair endonuclease
MKDHKKPIRATRPIRQQARDLRQAMTPAEKLLWQHLRNRKLAGLKFRRQHPIGRFIVDFYCASGKVVIELDGDVHQAQQPYDAARTEALAQQGCRVIRFSNEAVLAELEMVLASIEAACRTK